MYGAKDRQNKSSLLLYEMKFQKNWINETTIKMEENFIRTLLGEVFDSNFLNQRSEIFLKGIRIIRKCQVEQIKNILFIIEGFL